MILNIEDDFSLKKIIISGQCFRAVEIEEKKFRFITGDNSIIIHELGGNKFDVSCGINEWEKVWISYFDLERDYSSIRKEAAEKNFVVKKAVDFANGIRILRQDPWETLITFILSQRKSLPAIANSVEALCRTYGHKICELNSFPSVEEMSGATEEELRELGTGYRAPYVLSAIEKVLSKEIDLKEMENYDDETLHKSLISIHGVGDKVANCVSLFGFGRIKRAPIDVWIKRIIDEDFGGENPFPLFPNDAGIIQQYLFYYAKYRGLTKE